jgi:hypothetical protein
VLCMHKLELDPKSVRGKGHLHTCIAGRKDNLRRSILRKDNPKTKIKILAFKDCKEIRKVSKEIRKVSKEIRIFS